MLKDYSYDMVQVANKLLDGWEKMIQSDPIIDIKNQISSTTFDIVGRTFFGVDFDALSAKSNIYFKSLTEILRLLIMRTLFNKIWFLFKKEDENMKKGK